jgi:hypothetical protein
MCSKEFHKLRWRKSALFRSSFATDGSQVYEDIVGMAGGRRLDRSYTWNDAKAKIKGSNIRARGTRQIWV